MSPQPDLAEYDLADLLMVFDDLHSLSAEERYFYWLIFSRADGLSVTLTFDALERRDRIYVSSAGGIGSCSVGTRDCFAVRVLDVERKTLEVLGGAPDAVTLRCFLWLNGDSVLEVEHPPDNSPEQ